MRRCPQVTVTYPSQLPDRARNGHVCAHPYSEPVITVVEYDPAWPERFEMLRNEYAVAMAGPGPGRCDRTCRKYVRPWSKLPSPSSTVTSLSARPM